MKNTEIKKSTIIDVSKRAKVSTATVSRVYNGNYPVRSKTREKVLRAMQELNFEINQNARNLRRNFSKMIGIIVADISNPYFMKIAKGVEEMANPEGYLIVYASADNNPEKEADLIRMFAQYRVDGVVLASCVQDAATINDVIQQSMSCVLVDSPIPGARADSVVENDEEAAQALAEYVLGMGHRDICFVNGDMRTSTANARFQGFTRAMRRYGLVLKPEQCIEGMFSRAVAGERLAAYLDARPNPPSALVTASNDMTEGVLETLVARELRIPVDVSLASFNEVEFSGIIRPALTHMTDNTLEIGRKAGEILMEHINSEKTRSSGAMEYRTICFSKRLVEGASVKRMNE